MRKHCVLTFLHKHTMYEVAAAQGRVAAARTQTAGTRRT